MLCIDYLLLNILKLCYYKGEVKYLFNNNLEKNKI